MGPPIMRFLLPLLLVTAAESYAQADVREAYDVEAYHLDLRFDPERRHIEGTVSVELVVTSEDLDEVRLDMASSVQVDQVGFTFGGLEESAPVRGKLVYHKHAKDRLDCQLDPPVDRGGRITLSITYSASPGILDEGHGMRWAKSPDDARTLVDMDYQNVGAHHWFPCKASRYHPEDRPKRVLIDATVPDDLVAAAPGRLIGSAEKEPGWITWSWRHDYPIATYGIGVAIGPYERVDDWLDLPELSKPVKLQYFVLPEDMPAARVQFGELADMLSVYTRAFGPWPFPRSKVGVAQGSWLTADHSTMLSYGSSFPTWYAARDEEDPGEKWNRGYDYVLAHQMAHEWWGNSVGAESWRDYWLHEGLATFAEGLWIEHLYGRERADAFFTDLSRRLRSNLKLIRSDADYDGARAFSPVLYLKGAWVLHLARHYVADDDLFFAALRTFQETHRGGLASTDDLRHAFEQVTEQEWGRFFDEWVYGTGSPRLEGHVAVHQDRLQVEVINEVSATRSFRVPLDIQWIEDGEQVSERLWLDPGEHKIDLPSLNPERVRVVGVQRLLGRHRIAVSDCFSAEPGVGAHWPRVGPRSGHSPANHRTL